MYLQINLPPAEAQGAFNDVIVAYKYSMYLQINITARSAAISPGTADSLETFQGEYVMHSVGSSKKQQPQMILNIGMVNGKPHAPSHLVHPASCGHLLHGSLLDCDG